MAPRNEKSSIEREHTDESLRVERERVDEALGDPHDSIDEAADAVINRARERADAVLAAARATVDRQRAKADPGTPTPTVVARERSLEDAALRDERAEADETLRVERAEHAALLVHERSETDKDLSRERARSDVAVATRDEFLAVVSHDLRNMLNVMVGFASLIGRAVEREGHEAEVLLHAQRIQRSGGRMNRLIGDLVDVASIEAGVLAVSREDGDPALVVTEAVETFQTQATASGITLAAQIEQTPRVSFDPARILQVLINLISNAIKFTPHHGTVSVRVEPAGDEVQFSVSDTGEGIEQDQLELVFERFRQVILNDRRGMGLGLYISKCIIQGHGGRIWATSVVGEGSTFCFTLPRARD